MRAVTLIEAGDPPLLEVGDVEAVDGWPVRCADVEPLDVQVASGAVPRRLPLIPGSAAVIETEAGLRYVVPGHGHGTLVERLRPPEEYLVPVPEGLGAATAAVAGPVAVAHLALFDRARLEPGEEVLVVGASGLVGRAAAQLAAANHAHVIAAAREPSAVPKHDSIDAIGLEGLPDRVAELTGGEGVDVIVDVVGGPILDDVVAAGADGCRHVLVGTAGGAVARLTLSRLLASEHRLIGFRRSATPLDLLVAAHRRGLADLAEGRVTLPDIPRFRLDDAAEAFAVAAARGGHVLVIPRAAHGDSP